MLNFGVFLATFLRKCLHVAMRTCYFGIYSSTSGTGSGHSTTRTGCMLRTSSSTLPTWPCNKTVNSVHGRPFLKARAFGVAQKCRGGTP